MREPKEIITYWYEQIGFPESYNESFFCALKKYEINTETKVSDYEDKGDGVENFLYFLYFCEELRQQYRKMGISEKILRDTISDLTIWLNIWSGLKGGLYLGEIKWLKLHFSMKLFRLGRLQYGFKTMERDLSELGIVKGNKVIEVHIPALGPLVLNDCIDSLDVARTFFEKYFPEYEYEYFSCHSWLLDEDLVELLGGKSNIVMFGRLFNIVDRDESDAILNYTLRWKIKREEVSTAKAKSSLAKKVQQLALEGKVFHDGYGFIRK